MNNNPGTEEVLRKELGALGAREYEVVALTMNVDRGLAALRYAVSKGANNPISYAIKIFDDDNWQPSGETRRQATNQAVDKACPHCDGHRLVLVGADVFGLYGETYAPCVECNAKADTTRWVWKEKRVTAPR